MAVHRGGLCRLCTGVALRVQHPIRIECLQRTCQGPLVVLRQAVEVRREERACAAVDHVHTLRPFQLHRKLVLETESAPTSTHTQMLIVLIIQIALDQLLKEDRRREGE